MVSVHNDEFGAGETFQHLLICYKIYSHIRGGGAGGARRSKSGKEL